MLRLLVFSLLLLAAPAFADRDCAWAPPEAMHCCEQHAITYMIGGTELQREHADRHLHWCLKAAGVDKELVDAILVGTRSFAGPWCRGYDCWRYPQRPVCFGAWCRRWR